MNCDLVIGCEFTVPAAVVSKKSCDLKEMY